MNSSEKKIKTEYEIKVDDSTQKLSKNFESGKIYRLELQFKDNKFRNLLTNLVLKIRTENDLKGLDAEKMLANDQELLKHLNAYIQREIDWVEKGDSYRALCNTMLESIVFILKLRRPKFLQSKTLFELEEMSKQLIKLREMIVSDQPVPTGTLTKLFEKLLETKLENVKIIVKEVIDEY